MRNYSRLDALLDRLQGDIRPEERSRTHDGVTFWAVTRLARERVLKPGMAVLDVGCGQGPALDLFRQIGVQAYGITLSATDFERCLDRGHDVAPMDQSFLSLPDARYDVLFCRHVLEHSPFPLYTLTEYRRVLKPGGRLYVEVPAPDTCCRHETNPQHHSVLGKSMWLELFARAGFDLVWQDDIPVDVPAGMDLYWAFLLRAKRTRRRPDPPPPRRRTRPTRSFVIPALDLSPAATYNLGTLLVDLTDIPGDVVVVFNDPALAARFDGHPRITRSAAMSQNLGVPRAWNVGLEMADTPHVFFLNADLHVRREAVDAVEAGLETLDRAACVGPEGSLVDVWRTRNLVQIYHGIVGEPAEVDAVSGYMFAVRRDDFGPGGFRFENAYTPCYFEEWDLGLQIRRAGRKCWVVPTDACEHGVSGTIAARRTLPYMGRAAAPRDVLARNRKVFLAKWRAIAKADGGAPWAESGVGRFARRVVLESLRAERTEDALRWAGSIAKNAPHDAAVCAVAAFAFGHAGSHMDAVAFWKRVAALDPAFDRAAFSAGLAAELGSTPARARTAAGRSRGSPGTPSRARPAPARPPGPTRAARAAGTGASSGTTANPRGRAASGNRR
jgi:SAM-dependent methyltransferase